MNVQVHDAVEEIVKRLTDWKKLARILQFDENQIKIIESNHRFVKDQCNEFINTFLQQNEDRTYSWEFWKENLKLFDEGRAVIKEIENIVYLDETDSPRAVSNDVRVFSFDFLNAAIVRISDSKAFAKSIDIPEFYVRHIELDYADDCCERARQYVKYYQDHNEKQHDMFWYEALLKFRNGKQVIEEMESDFPELLHMSSADHTYSDSRCTYVCHHYTSEETMKVLPFNEEKVIEVNVGAGETIIYDLQKYSQWVSTHHEYLKTYLSFEDTYVMDFSSNRENQCQIMRAVENGFQEAHDEGFIFKSYNLKRHYSLFGSTVMLPEDLEKFIVAYSIENNVLMYINYCDDVTSIGKVAHSLLQQIQLMTSLHDVLNDISVTHVGIVIYDEPIDDKYLCKTCLDNGLIVSKKQFTEDFVSWLNLMLERNDILQNNNTPQDKYDLKAACNKVRDSIITIMALHSYNFATFTSVPDDRMNELKKLVLLTADQFKILYSLDTHILIKGGYGSGKSLVFQKKFEHVLERSHDIDIFYFLCQDHQSRFALQMKYVKEKFPSKHILICNSRDVVGMSVQLTSLLQHFQRIWKNHRVHLFTDEFCGGSIDNKESETLKRLLNEFRDSYIVIGMQSMEHDETIVDEATDKTYLYDFLENEMKFQVFRLNYSLRCSVEINKFVAETVDILETVHLNTSRQSMNDHIFSDYNAVVDREHGMENTDSVDGPISVVNKYKYNSPEKIGHDVNCNNVQIYTLPRETNDQIHEMYYVYLLVKQIISLIEEDNEQYRVTICVFTKSMFNSIYKILDYCSSHWCNKIGEFNKDDCTDKILLVDYASIRGYEYENVICILPKSMKYLKYRFIECFTRATKHLYLIVPNFNENVEEDYKMLHRAWSKSEWTEMFRVNFREKGVYLSEHGKPDRMLKESYPELKGNLFYDDIENHYPWGDVMPVDSNNMQSHHSYDLERAIDLVTMYDDKVLFESLVEDHDVNIKDKKGMLQRSVERDAKGVLSLLIEKYEIHVNAPDFTKMTALHKAAQKDNIVIAQVLLGYGANANLRDGDGLKPIDYAESDEMKELLGAHTSFEEESLDNIAEDEIESIDTGPPAPPLITSDHFSTTAYANDSYVDIPTDTAGSAENN